MTGEGVRMQNLQQLLALKSARMLKKQIMKRRRGKPITKSVRVLEQVRKERIGELLGHRR
jgi:hypothetical protein